MKPARKQSAAEPLTYAYAVVRSPRAPALARAPAGLPGAGKIRAVPLAKNAWLVVSDAPAETFSADAIESKLRDMAWVGERALGHERVVEHLAKKWPTVPLKLFTLFSGDARAVSQFGPERAKLERALDRISGCAEWGVRVTFDELAARRRAADEARSASPGASGTAFLLKKKKEHDVQRQLVHHAQQEVDAAFDALAKHAKQSKRRAPGPAEIGARILLEAAFLVSAKDAKKFERSVVERTKELAPRGYTVALTGPWPAYSFVEST